jgi:hypothetical protein
MPSSAISPSVAQQLAANIFNADGVTPVYSAGAWALKNSSGVTTFSVSDAGAAVIGPIAAAATSQYLIQAVGVSASASGVAPAEKRLFLNCNTYAGAVYNATALFYIP